MTINYKIIENAYSFIINENGEIYGLVYGDMGYEPTGIKLDNDTLKIWQIGSMIWKILQDKENK